MPNYDSHGEFVPQVRINSLGFRGRECQIEKPSGVYRILCLGDSSTFGFSVPVGCAYPSLLESRLNASDAYGDKRFEVTNAGVHGYTSFQCLRLYEHRGAQLQPDLVVLYVGPNDIKPCPMADEQIAARAAPKAIMAMNQAFSHLHCYRSLRSAVVEPPPAVPKEPVPRVGVEGYVRNVLELRRQCEAAHCHLVLVSFAYRTPFPPDLSKKYVTGLPTLRRTLVRLAEKDAILLVDLPAMREESGGQYRELFQDIVHPNEAGHRYIADRIYDKLADEGVLPTLDQP